MTFALSQLTQNLLLQVLRRMEAESLCHLRQTCKRLNTFAEDNRFKIATRREDSDWILLIEKESENNDALLFSLRKWDNTMDFGDAEWWFGRTEEEEEEEDNSAVLTAPFDQLSAISLRAVLLFSKNCVPECNHLTTNLPAVLSPFKFHVEWLCLCHHTTELLQSVDFRRLRVQNEKSEESVPIIGIENLKELALRTDEEYDFSVCRQLFSITETLSLDYFDCKKCTEFIKQLLTNLQLDENVLGILKLLRILLCWDDDEMVKFVFTDVEPFHYLQITDCHRLDFYIIPISSGFAIVVHGMLFNNYLEMHFVEDDSRETLLNVLWRYLSPIPPTEEDVVYFVEAESEEDATDDFYRLHRDDIHFVEESLKPQLISETEDCNPLPLFSDLDEW